MPAAFRTSKPLLVSGASRLPSSNEYGERWGSWMARTHKKPIPAELRWQIWERDNFTCRKCGVRRHLSIDHIVPEMLGGQTVEGNLQTLCWPCNRAKGTIDPRKPIKQAPAKPLPMDPFLTVREISDHLQVHPGTVKLWLREKRLKGFVLSDRAGWRVTRADLEEFIRDVKKHDPVERA